MDTTFWGPDGWKLLHSIAVHFPENPTDNAKKQYKKFFKTLPYVLPCKYCRDSLSEFYIELPIEPFLVNKKKLFEWSYRIHNKVNDKLRRQGLCTDENPKKKECFDYYTSYIKDLNNNNCIDMPGWDFMYSLTFNYCTNIDKFASKYRAAQYKTFYRTLEYVLPFKVVKSLYGKKINDTDFLKAFSTRDRFKKWLYSIEHFVKKNINSECLSYSMCCKRVEKYRASCGSKTCRR